MLTAAARCWRTLVYLSANAEKPRLFIQHGVDLVDTHLVLVHEMLYDPSVYVARFTVKFNRAE